MFRRIAFTVVAVSLLSTAAFAQTSATATANASARVLTPITITKLTDLNFGSLVAGPLAGTVVIDPFSARTATGGVSLVNSAFSAAASSPWPAVPRDACACSSWTTPERWPVKRPASTTASTTSPRSRPAPTRCACIRRT